ncbi:MAG: hypothetical protein ACFCVK_23670 [Acidimicrobiales bacterium]
MTNQFDFTNDEWEALSAAPVLVGVAMARAADSGRFGSYRESRAVMAALEPDVTGSPAADLIRAAAAADVTELIERLTVGDTIGPEAWAELAVTACAEAADALIARALPEEATGFTTWLLAVANDVANAAKEGGVRISPPEADLLRRLAAALRLDVASD